MSVAENKKIIRCEWPGSERANEIMMKYHDEEWGVPLHNDKKLFEFITLEGAQAGLSWSTVLNKRKGYRKVFVNFDYNKVAKFEKKDIKRLMNDENIIRNRLKIESTISNAKAFIEVRSEFGTFDKYIWNFVKGKQIKNKFKKIMQIPATTTLSDTISKDLKNRGFRFIGTTIVYAYMQATGMVNDHIVSCFRYEQV